MFLFFQTTEDDARRADTAKVFLNDRRFSALYLMQIYGGYLSSWEGPTLLRRYHLQATKMEDFMNYRRCVFEFILGLQRMRVLPEYFKMSTLINQLYYLTLETGYFETIIRACKWTKSLRKIAYKFDSLDLFFSFVHRKFLHILSRDALEQIISIRKALVLVAQNCATETKEGRPYLDDLDDCHMYDDEGCYDDIYHNEFHGLDSAIEEEEESNEDDVPGDV